MAQAIANKLNIMRVCSSENHGQTIANKLNIMRAYTGEKHGTGQS
jgi:hypothetical protein